MTIILFIFYYFFKVSAGSSDEEDQNGDENAINPKEYDYLVSMSMWNLTVEKIEKLKDLIAQKYKEIGDLKSTTIQQMWNRDLDDFLEVLEEVTEQDEQDRVAQSNVNCPLFLTIYLIIFVIFREKREGLRVLERQRVL